MLVKGTCGCLHETSPIDNMHVALHNCWLGSKKGRELSSFCCLKLMKQIPSIRCPRVPLPPDDWCIDWQPSCLAVRIVARCMPSCVGHGIDIFSNHTLMIVFYSTLSCQMTSSSSSSSRSSSRRILCHAILCCADWESAGFEHGKNYTFRSPWKLFVDYHLLICASTCQGTVWEENWTLHAFGWT